MTSYGEVAHRVTVTDFDTHFGLMNHLLGEIFEEECACRRPALTSIVIHKDGDMEPGPGFYDMARKLGYTFDEPFVFRSSQFQEMFKLHGRPPRNRRT